MIASPSDYGSRGVLRKIAQADSGFKITEELDMLTGNHLKALQSFEGFRALTLERSSR